MIMDYQEELIDHQQPCGKNNLIQDDDSSNSLCWENAEKSFPNPLQDDHLFMLIGWKIFVEGKEDPCYGQIC